MQIYINTHISKHKRDPPDTSNAGGPGPFTLFIYGLVDPLHCPNTRSGSLRYVSPSEPLMDLAALLVLAVLAALSFAFIRALERR